MPPSEPAEPLSVGVATACLHRDTVPAADIAAGLVCLACRDPLPPSWGCPGCVWADAPLEDGDFRRFYLRDACAAHREDT